MAHDRLVGKGLKQLDVMGGERTGIGRVTLIMPTGVPGSSAREQHAAKTSQSPQLSVGGRDLFGFGVGELYGLAVANQRKGWKFFQAPRERRFQGVGPPRHWSACTLPDEAHRR